MSERLKKTIRIQRRASVNTDDRGRNVWTDTIETAELELVSTVMLKKIIDSGDDERKERLREAAEGKDGILAHDPQSDRFEIVDDDDLKAALQSAAGVSNEVRAADVTYEPQRQSGEGDADELSLVSTQALRRILNQEPEVEADEAPPAEQGFDPYNSG